MSVYSLCEYDPYGILDFTFAKYSLNRLNNLFLNIDGAKGFTPYDFQNFQIALNECKAKVITLKCVRDHRTYEIMNLLKIEINLIINTARKVIQTTRYKLGEQIKMLSHDLVRPGLPWNQQESSMKLEVLIYEDELAAMVLERTDELIRLT